MPGEAPTSSWRLSTVPTVPSGCCCGVANLLCPYVSSRRHSMSHLVILSITWCDPKLPQTHADARLFLLHPSTSASKAVQIAHTCSLASQGHHLDPSLHHFQTIPSMRLPLHTKHRGWQSSMLSLRNKEQALLHEESTHPLDCILSPFAPLLGRGPRTLIWNLKLVLFSLTYPMFVPLPLKGW